MERIDLKTDPMEQSPSGSLMEPSKPPGWRIWHENRDGACFVCGAALGRYDSKFIEQTPPHRLLCKYLPTDDTAHGEAIAQIHDRRLWYYWTDG